MSDLKERFTRAAAALSANYEKSGFTFASLKQEVGTLTSQFTAEEFREAIELVASPDLYRVHGNFRAIQSGPRGFARSVLMHLMPSNRPSMCHAYLAADHICTEYKVSKSWVPPSMIIREVLMSAYDMQLGLDELDFFSGLDLASNFGESLLKAARSLDKEQIAMLSRAELLVIVKENASG